jgi:hypothetical protein
LTANAGIAQFLDCLLRLALVARRNRYSRSRLGEAARHAETNSAVAAGNDGNAAGKIK